jgi:uncharacterized protein (TIGR02217 family)
MSFLLNERFPVEMEYGGSFSHRHAVQINSTQDGGEYRRLLHPFVKTDFEMSFKNLEDWVMDEVVDFYQRTNGSFRGFRVKDLSDFTTNNFKDAPTNSDMRCVALNASGGNATQFQITRWYGDPTDTYCARRYIKKPVSSTVVVSKLTAPATYTPLILTTDYTIDYETGIITTVASQPADKIYAGCEFDIPCRFDGEPSFSYTSWDVLTATGIKLIEIFNP